MSEEPKDVEDLEPPTLRLDVLRRCRRRQPIREIAEELGLTAAAVAKIRQRALTEARGLEIAEAKLLLQLEIEATRDDLRRLEERQEAHPAHGYDLYYAKLAVQERLLRLHGIDVSKVAAQVQINVNSPGAALQMQQVPTIELQRLLDEVTGVPALGSGAEPADDSAPEGADQPIE